jgi:hypothetical protein
VKVTEIAEAIVAVIAGIGLKKYLWEPKDLKPPAGAVHVPHIKRTKPDEAESQLGSDDWDLDFTVSLYFDLAEAAKAQQSMVDAVERFIDAIDEDPSLGGVVLEASVTDAVPFIERDRPRPVVGYECTVSVLRLVSS